MSFEIEAEGLDVARLLADVHRRIEERRASGLYTEEELRYIAERPLEPVLQARDVSRGARRGVPRARRAVELLLRPRDDLPLEPRGDRPGARRCRGGCSGRCRSSFWNPTPMISALSRQSDLNRFTAHLLHNLVLELTRLNLEVQELKNRNLQLSGRVEMLARRAQDARGHGWGA